MKRHLARKTVSDAFNRDDFLPIFDILIRVDVYQKVVIYETLIVLDLLLAIFNANLDLDKIWLNEYKREQFDEYIVIF